jgi:hypothetical protein
VFDDMEFVVVVVVFDAIALAEVLVAEVSADGVVVVVVVVLVSVAVALVSAAVLVSAFFWQAATPRARTAAAATEVTIRSFMDCSPGGLSPDARLIHGFVISRNRDPALAVNFCRKTCGFRGFAPLGPGLRIARAASRVEANRTLKLGRPWGVGGV